MSKRLIMILTLAFVVGITFAAYAEVQNVKVSGDITVSALARNLGLSSYESETAMVSQIRLRVDADLTDNVSTTLRLINERYWGRSGDNTSTDGDSNTSIDLDLAYVTMKEFLYSPLTLTVGRQELHFGNDMIIGDAYTNGRAPTDSVFSSTIDADLNMRKSFDAIRASLNYDPLVIDVVGAQIRKVGVATAYDAGSNIALNNDNQEQLYGVNLGYALNKKTTLEAYAWERRVGADALTAMINKTDRTDTVGARFSTKPMENLTVQGEGAYQFGKVVNGDANLFGVVLAGKNDATRSAWAAQTSVAYDLKNVKYIGKYSPTATLMYSYFSGDAGTGKKYTGWDVMYENQTFGSIANNLFPQTNQHTFGGALTAKPMADVSLKGEYFAYWWDKKWADAARIRTLGPQQLVTMTNKKSIGQELDLTATYDYTEDVQFSLLGGLFFAGSSFDKQNRDTAGELIGKMKVTF